MRSVKVGFSMSTNLPQMMRPWKSMAARGVGGGSADEGEEGAQAAPVDAAALAAATSSGAVDTQQLEYVRTYARVAHTQRRAVLGALNEELDRLADLADGRVEQPAPEVPEPPAAAASDDDVPGAADESELGHG